MKKPLKALIKSLESITVKGSKDVEILGLCNNSKSAAPGYVFFAKKGARAHGNHYIQEAIDAGCICVVTDLYDPFLQVPSQVITSDVQSLESAMTQRFYGDPSKGLFTVGITGTNGKTTTSYLIKDLFEAFLGPAGLIGTVEWAIKDTSFPSTHTTPDVITNHKLLYEMGQMGCKSAIMEVSSHGLEQNRVSGIDFDVAVYTNLTEEHLDYHKTFDAYARAKAKLFSSHAKQRKTPKYAVINADCPWHEAVTGGFRGPKIFYGFSDKAQLRAQDLELSPEGFSCQVTFNSESFLLKCPLVGRFNVYNSLAALGTCLAAGIDLQKSLEHLATFSGVRGRLEKIQNAEGKQIFVDYAHTEDALKGALEALREVCEGRLLCVFGCGGDRDRGKRPKMGAAAEAGADRVFVTSDNPRTESPESIIEQILSGIKEKTHVCVEVQRRAAIERAIETLDESDVLLIAGKGHEDYQIFSDRTLHFDDRIVAKEYCDARLH